MLFESIFLLPFDYFIYMQDHKLTPFVKSEPIPEVNDQPVKIVVTKNLNDVVYASGKNGLFKLYVHFLALNYC